MPQQKLQKVVFFFLFCFVFLIVISSSGFGFVRFGSEEERNLAIQEMQVCFSLCATFHFPIGSNLQWKSYQIASRSSQISHELSSRCVTSCACCFVEESAAYSHRPCRPKHNIERPIKHGSLCRGD